MSEIRVGPQDHCVQCGLSREDARYSQQIRQPIRCASEDPWGEICHKYERHKFVWTAKDQQREDRFKAMWALEEYTIPEMPAVEATASRKDNPHEEV